MRINKITAALRGAKRGLILHELHDNEYGRPFCGCSIGEFLHAAGLNRRQIDRDPHTGDSDDYGIVQDGLLGRVYDLDELEIVQFHSANDCFEGEPIERRDYMVRWSRAFHKLRKAGVHPDDADLQAREVASA